MMTKRRMPAHPRAPNSLAPLRILKQIAILQLTYYVSATLLILFTTLVAGQPFSANMILGSAAVIRGDTVLGLTMVLLWLLSDLFVVLAMVIVLARSKLVLDFALTLHFLHLLITSIYMGSIPREIAWWSLQGLSSVGMIVLGGWACRWRELRPISIATPREAGRVVEREEEFEMVPMLGKEESGRGIAAEGSGEGREI